MQDPFTKAIINGEAAWETHKAMYNVHSQADLSDCNDLSFIMMQLSCYHASQSAEHYVLAICHYHNIEFKPNHNLHNKMKLLQGLLPGISPSLLRDCRQIVIANTHGRYARSDSHTELTLEVMGNIFRTCGLLRRMMLHYLLEQRHEIMTDMWFRAAANSSGLSAILAEYDKQTNAAKFRYQTDRTTSALNLFLD